jgi:hypothetical protein
MGHISHWNRITVLSCLFDGVHGSGIKAFRSIPANRPTVAQATKKPPANRGFFVCFIVLAGYGETVPFRLTPEYDW